MKVENILTEEEIMETEEEKGTIDKTGMEEERLKELFNQTILSFKLRWESKNSPVSQAGIYNYAISIMRYEFYNKFDNATANYLVEQYKP